MRISMVMMLVMLAAYGCAAIREDYDASALSVERQEIVAEAMAWWNERDANFSLTLSDTGASVIEYGAMEGAPLALHSFFWNDGVAQRIVLNASAWIGDDGGDIGPADLFCGLIRHELGHQHYAHSQDQHNVMYYVPPPCLEVSAISGFPAPVEYP